MNTAKKRDLKFYMSIYKKILIQDLKSKMSYRADFIISTFGMVLTNVVGFISFYILFQNFPSINGWNYYEMLFLYGFSLVALTPVQCLFDNNWNLRFQVLSGDFIKYCFRPINIFFYFMSEIFDIKGLGQLAFGIGTIIFAWMHLDIPVTPVVLIELAIYLFAASLFMISIMNASAANIFNTFFRFFFTFIIPIAFVAYYPSLVILRPDSIPLLSWLSPLIGLFFFYLSYKFWMHGAKKYNGTGS